MYKRSQHLASSSSIGAMGVSPMATLLTELEGSVLGCDGPAKSVAELSLGWN